MPCRDMHATVTPEPVLVDSNSLWSQLNPVNHVIVTDLVGDVVVLQLGLFLHGQ